MTELVRPLHELDQFQYSERSGEVRVTARLEKDSVAVTVRDEGIGIPPHALEKIFGRFYRVDNTARREFGGPVFLFQSCRPTILSKDLLTSRICEGIVKHSASFSKTLASIDCHNRNNWGLSRA